MLASIYAARDKKDQDVLKAYKQMGFSEKLARYKNLTQIVFMGDFLNHAIFTDDELLDSISRLSKAGLIEEIDGFLLPTSKLENLYKNATAKMKSVSRDVALQIFAKILQTKLPYD